MVRLPRLAARYPCRSPATPRARPLAQGCLLSAGEGAPSARGCQGAVAAGTTRRPGTRSKSPSALPPDLAGTAGLQRHEPRLTAATPLARRRPPPGAARGGRAEPRARRRRGAGDGARRRQGATGRARGVLCATADFVESVALRIGARMRRCIWVFYILSLSTWCFARLVAFTLPLKGPACCSGAENQHQPKAFSAPLATDYDTFHLPSLPMIAIGGVALAGHTFKSCSLPKFEWAVYGKYTTARWYGMTAAVTGDCLTAIRTR